METRSNRQTNLLNTEDKRERKELLKNMILDAVLFNEFYDTLDDVELIYLSQNNSLTTPMICRLFDKSLDNVNVNLLKNRRCPLEMIESFLKLNDKVYNIALSHNGSLNTMQFYKLLEKLDLDVNISLAFNKATPKEIIKELVLLNNTLINQALCSNPTTPVDILENFLCDDKMKSCLSQNDSFKLYSKNIITT